jgi:hypothetical protein
MADQAAETLQYERRRGNYAMGAALGAFVLFFAGQVLQTSGSEGVDGDAERLVDRADKFDQLLAGAIVMLVAFVLVSLALGFLYKAALSRSDSMRPTFAPMIPLGAVLIGISGILLVFALDAVSDDFLAGTPTTGDEAEDRAEDLIGDSGLYETASFIGIAGLFSLAVGAFYTALHSMRVGLVTRFMGTLGMALSVILLISPIGMIVVLLWTVIATLVAVGRWPGQRPPAWEAGVAVPWPAPGQQAAAAPEPEEEPASPEDFEGTATEVSERPGRRDNKRKRKRKAR